MNTESSFDQVLGNSGVRVAVIGVLAILALFLFAETVSVAQNFGRPSSPPTNTITVEGMGTATAVPDTAHITFTVQESAKDVATAQAAATKRTGAVLASLTKEGVADKDVKTQSYNVTPQYSNSVVAPCPPGALCPQQIMVQQSPVITGYEVSQSVQVTLHDPSKAGAVLGMLGTAGVQNVSGPDLVVDDPDAVQSQARAQAIEKARANAQVLAGQLGVHLGEVVSFSENGNQPYPMYSAKSAGVASADAVAPSVPVGQNEYTSNVSITYEIR